VTHILLIEKRKDINNIRNPRKPTQLPQLQETDLIPSSASTAFSAKRGLATLADTSTDKVRQEFMI